MKLKTAPVMTVIALLWVGCSSDSGGTGSSGGSGGQAQTGGSGGNSGTGGVSSKGGSGGSSAGAGSGGNSAGGSGGNSPGGAGGAGNTGGRSGEGGSGSGGAITATGGAAAGGTTGAGGTIGSGGSMGSGGSGAAGSAKGGAPGGSTGSGGSGGGNGGGTVSVGASGYPAAGASGQAKPTGAGTKVTVLDWAGFKSAISFTFDDTNQTQIDHYKELQALNDKGNVHYTFFLWTGKNEINNGVWPQAQKDGHELGNHTKSHQSAANASDIDAAETTIKTMFGTTAYSIAAPNGDASYQSAAKGKFLTNRTAGDSGGVSPTDNPATRQYALPCIIPATGASSSTMQSSLNAAVTSGKWEIFLVHGFTGGSDGAYQPVDVNQFTAVVTWAKNQGNVWLDSVGTVSAYWVAQYNFNKLTPASNGTDKTWTWKTSDFSTPFPPGKYLRVKTDGGTLKQGNTVLSWDDHGYYEVSLDAGTLTLSP
jgi:peptidoglycan/xylan/chitin deacetylase (PgdA/CDA1 family)